MSLVLLLLIGLTYAADGRRLGIQATWSFGKEAQISHNSNSAAFNGGWQVAGHRGRAAVSKLQRMAKTPGTWLPHRGSRTSKGTRHASVSMVTPSEIIDFGVKVDTFAPQFLWLAMVVAPKSKITESVMGPIGPILALSLVHLVVVLLAATKPGGVEPILIFLDVFRPDLSQLDGMQRLFQVRDFVAEEWPHVLIWDLFVGRAIWLDGISRNVPFLAPSLLLCNFIGPPGLLLYALTCSLTGVGLPPLGYQNAQESE